MEKSRAIELLEHLAWDRDIERNPYGDALNMAIEALKAQLSQKGTTSDLISRQAAIDAIAEQMPTPYTPDGSHPADEQIFQVQEVYADCITAIELLPTIQPVATDTNVGGTISRQQAIELIKNYCENGCDIAEDNWCPSCQREQFIKLLKALPTIQPERKKGEWLPDNNNAYEMRFVCSCCKESEVVPTIGFTKYKPIWDFCPNCGADMRGEKDG